MSRVAIEASDTKEQMLAELEQLLERQIAAARIDDLSTVEKLANECTKRAAAIGHTATVSDRKQKLQQLHRQLECILADKLAATEQQLASVQKSKKIFTAYRL
jgi:hypothetical protein